MTITVNGTESQEVGMQLGKEGEAFFLREVLEDEASESIGVSSSGHEHVSVSNRPAQGNTSMQALPSKD